MKEIEVRDQVSLPLRRCFQLCVRGIRYRLFRSAITVAIVTLAVAFLMMMLSTSYVDREVGADVRRRTADRRLLAKWLDKLSTHMTAKTLVANLADVGEGSDEARELQGWGEVEPEDLAKLSGLAKKQLVWAAYLDRMDAGDRNALLGTRDNEEAFEYLGDEKKRKDFVEGAAAMRAGRMPDSTEALAAFLKEFAQLKPLREKIIVGHKKAVGRLAAQLKAKGITVLDLLARQADTCIDLLAQYGFYLRESDLRVLTAKAAVASDIEELLSLLNNSQIRGPLSHKTGVKVAELSEKHVISLASSKRGAKWLTDKIHEVRKKTFDKIASNERYVALMKEVLALPPEQIVAMAKKELEDEKNKTVGEPGQLAKLAEIKPVREEVFRRLTLKAEIEVKPEHVCKLASEAEGARWLKLKIGEIVVALPLEIQQDREGVIEPLSLSNERIREVAVAWRKAERLNSIESSLPEAEGTGWLGFSDRTAWLIVISFVVCAVGVANAMLMSVTERFREIATMKCLGAMDSFIMISFVLESSLQGLAGGLMGVVIGFVLGALRSCWSFGTLVFVNLPGTILLASAGVCLVAGIVLAAMAALYPAWVAARLAPMEAMRIE